MRPLARHNLPQEDPITATHSQTRSLDAQPHIGPRHTTVQGTKIFYASGLAGGHNCTDHAVGDEGQLHSRSGKVERKWHSTKDAIKQTKTFLSCVHHGFDCESTIIASTSRRFILPVDVRGHADSGLSLPHLRTHPAKGSLPLHTGGIPSVTQNTTKKLYSARLYIHESKQTRQAASNSLTSAILRG